MLYGASFLAFVAVEFVSPAFGFASIKSTFALRGAAYILAGFLLIFFAPVIVRLSYASARIDED